MKTEEPVKFTAPQGDKDDVLSCSGDDDDVEIVEQPYPEDRGDTEDTDVEVEAEDEVDDIAGHGERMDAVDDDPLFSDDECSNVTATSEGVCSGDEGHTPPRAVPRATHAYHETGAFARCFAMNVLGRKMDGKKPAKRTKLVPLAPEPVSDD